MAQPLDEQSLFVVEHEGATIIGVGNARYTTAKKSRLIPFAHPSLNVIPSVIGMIFIRTTFSSSGTIFQQ